MGILLGRIVPGAELRVTRMRADLTHAALSEDLVLTAPADQSLLGTTRQVTRELNEPLCPVWQGCEQVGQAPRSEAAAKTDDSSSIGGGSCSTSNANAAGGTFLGGAFAVFGVALARLRRRRVARG
jgi:MYXO-CTERM domain-containing protein